MGRRGELGLISANSTFQQRCSAASGVLLHCEGLDTLAAIRMTARRPPPQASDPDYPRVPPRTATTCSTAGYWADLDQVVALVEKGVDASDFASAALAVNAFLDDLTNWFVRRSRRRFWKSEADSDKNAAYATLYYVLVKLGRTLAPFTPFVSEVIYQNLVRGVYPAAPIKRPPHPGRAPSRCRTTIPCSSRWPSPAGWLPGSQRPLPAPTSRCASRSARCWSTPGRPPGSLPCAPSWSRSSRTS